MRCSRRVLTSLFNKESLKTKTLGFLKRRWDLYIKENNRRQKQFALFYIYSQETSKGLNSFSCLILSLFSIMVMTRSGGFGRRKLMKGSSSSKGKTFDQ